MYFHVFSSKFYLQFAGHWQEDPCEFTQLSVSVPNERFHYFIEMFGERFYDDICTNYGMTAAFLSCTAQAHNEGRTGQFVADRLI